MKAAHELRGRPGGPVRLPLRPLGATEREELGQVVKQIVDFIAALDS